MTLRLDVVRHDASLGVELHARDLIVVSLTRPETGQKEEVADASSVRVRTHG